MRQAGNDGPLAFFTTLALYAAWRVLEDDGADASGSISAARTWRLLLYAALGLGFLCKGPIVLMLTSAAIVPYLIQAGRLAQGLRRLVDAPGLLIFAAIAASWPASVAWHDPNAPGLWLMEMSEKTGLLGTLIAPPAYAAGAALAEHDVPLVDRGDGRAGPAVPAGERGPTAATPRRRGPQASGRPSPAWFAWWWAVANMGIFCLWAVAKPYYYLPCMPGMALLAGDAWVRLSRRARGDLVRARPIGGSRRCCRRSGSSSSSARYRRRDRAAAVCRPVALAVRSSSPAAALAAAVFASVRAWRRGSDAMALSPIIAALAPGRAGRLRRPRPGREPAAQPPGAGPHPRPPRPSATCARSISSTRSTKGCGSISAGWTSTPCPAPSPDTARRMTSPRPTTPAATRPTLEVLDARREALEKQALLRWLDRPERVGSFRADPCRPLRSLRPRAGRPRDPGPPRVRPEPQRAGPAPQPRPPSDRRVRSAPPPLIPPSRPSPVRSDSTRPVRPRRRARISPTCRARRACRWRRLPGVESAGCAGPVGVFPCAERHGLPDRDDRHDFSP